MAPRITSADDGLHISRRISASVSVQSPSWHHRCAQKAPPSALPTISTIVGALLWRALCALPAPARSCSDRSPRPAPDDCGRCRSCPMPLERQRDALLVAVDVAEGAQLAVIVDPRREVDEVHRDLLVDDDHVVARGLHRLVASCRRPSPCPRPAPARPSSSGCAAAGSRGSACARCWRTSTCRWCRA